MNGSIVQPLLAAAAVLGCGDVVNSRPPSIPVLSALAAGGAYTCGMTGAGAASCWGNNSLGQLGDGSSANSSTLAAGTLHTCGLTTEGSAYCWGFNYFGQLGTAIGAGVLGPIPLPVAVSGGLRLRAITAGGGHTCGLLNDGPAVCWGNNYSGQLGDGSNTNSWEPVPVVWGVTFSVIR